MIGNLLASIKAEYLAHPPPPRPLPPPFPPIGEYFPELISDPAYSRLVKEEQKATAEYTVGDRLKQLGVSAPIYAKVVDLVAEETVSRLDYQSLAKTGKTGEFDGQMGSLHQQTLEQIRKVLGEALYLQFTQERTSIYRSIQDGVVTEHTDSVRDLPFDNGASTRFASLERRLSYSSEPLTEDQHAALEGMAQKNSMGLVGNRYLKSPEIRALLTAAQQAGLDELAAEAEAQTKRSKLPQSSAKPKS